MLERVRGAALRCLAAVAHDVCARAVMLAVAWDVAEAVAPLLGNGHAAALREAAAKVIGRSKCIHGACDLNLRRFGCAANLLDLLVEGVVCEGCR
jgi:hypothetical protein